METFYEQILSWYSDKPWWGKVLFFGVLLILGVLAVLRIFLPTPIKPIPAKPVTDPLFGMVTDVVDQKLEETKQELISKIGALRLVGVRAEERRKAIRSASSMDELDELKRKYDL
jgi:hypothetical protein